MHRYIGEKLTKEFDLDVEKLACKRKLSKPWDLRTEFIKVKLHTYYYHAGVIGEILRRRILLKIGKYKKASYL